jgi:hypothetical protein
MKESTIKWLKAAGIRALRTLAQSAIAAIGTAVAMGQVNWAMVASIAGLSAILSVLTSIKGLPEVPQEEGRE